MTPVIPHSTEELNEKLNFNNQDKEFISLTKFSTNLDKFINLKIEKDEKIIEDLTSNVLKLLENKSDVKKIKIVTAPKIKYELFEKLKELLDKTRDFKTIFNAIKEEKKFFSEIKFVQKFLPKTLKEGLTSYIREEDEIFLLKENLEFFKKEFGVNCEILDSSCFTSKNNAIPTKPQIIFE